MEEKQHTFRIGAKENDRDFEWLPVYLDEKEVYRIDVTKYMGVQRPPRDEELCDVLSEIVGWKVSKSRLNVAKIMGILTR